MRSAKVGTGGKLGKIETLETASSTTWEDGRRAEVANGGNLDVLETASSTAREDGRRAAE